MIEILRNRDSLSSCRDEEKKDQIRRIFSFSCAIRIENIENCDEDFGFWFFFVAYKEWPKDAFYGGRTRMSAHEDFDSSFSFFVCYRSGLRPFLKVGR